MARDPHRIKKERQFPQENDKFWYLDNFGIPRGIYWQEKYETHYTLLRQGNVFTSEETAQREARRREVKARIAAIDAECEPRVWQFFLKTGGKWRGQSFRRTDFPTAGRIHVRSIEAAERVLAEIPAEDLDLLTMEPEFVPPKGDD